MPDRTLHDDVDALHRDAASRRRIAVDTQQTANPGRTRGLTGVSHDMDPPRHHILSNPRSGVAVDRNARLLVHAGAVVASVSFDRDRHRSVDAYRNDCATRAD